ncbi:MAG: beta-lactamase family protein [Actinomycetota bacterium]|nr:beta-lactamase family protein [Actinomycetota bacterium]
MVSLQELVDEQCRAGRVPGAVALVTSGDDVEVACAGERAIDGEPMSRDTLFRIASITKPIIAAATMALVERGRLTLDESVERLLPELADPVVLRAVDGPVDDVVPAERAITVRDLLTFQAGHGFPPDFTAPVVALLMGELLQGPPQPQKVPPPDEWMARLGRIPLLHQPGKGWTYNAGSDILGVLIARSEGASLGDVLADTILDPLGMRDTAFAAVEVDRLASYYRRSESGTSGSGFELVDPPDGQWASVPAFQSGAGGLVSTVDDWLTFGRMLVAGGEHDGRRVLTCETVEQMMTSHAEAEPGNPFLQGQGWGFGGSVDLDESSPWNVPGRYGWIGGTGTAGYVTPSSARVSVWLSQVELGGADDLSALGEFLTWTAAR